MITAAQVKRICAKSKLVLCAPLIGKAAPAARPPKYTQDEIAQVREMQFVGMSALAAAKALGVSESRVIQIGYETGQSWRRPAHGCMEPRPLRDVDRPYLEAVAACQDEGLTIRQASAKIGINEFRVQLVGRHTGKKWRARK